MNHLFVPYEESLELKELGFDEPCLGYFNTTSYLGIGSFVFKECDKSTIDSYGNKPLLRPTFSQAFRWFREKYELDCSFEDFIVEDEDDNEIQMWDFFIYKTKQKSDNKVMDFCSNNSNTYIESYSREEAELECLRKLIQIVKTKR